MNLGYRFVGIVLALLFATSMAEADTLVRKGGKVYEGKVISQNGREVVFKVYKYGKPLYPLTISLSEIISLEKGEIKQAPKKKKKKEDATQLDLPAEPKAPEVVQYSGPTYYVIPLEGVVGQEMVAEVLEKALIDAIKRKPTVVVLKIDSPGGLLAEVEKLVEVICKYNKKLRMVVYVNKEAISAAAITSLAAKEIYTHPLGVCGAATAYRMSREGMPEDIGEKMQSIWRANARSAADIGGHSPLLAEAMIDRMMSLYVVEEDGKKVIKEGRARGGARQVITKGKLLTMTAREMVACGLARDIAENIDDLGEKLGYSEWTECEGLGTKLADHRKKVVKTVQERFKEIMKQFADHVESAHGIDPQKGRYLYWKRTKKLIPASKKKWKDRSHKCLRYLKKADEALVVATKLAEKYPQVLSADARKLEEIQAKVESFRKRVKMDINRTNR